MKIMRARKKVQELIDKNQKEIQQHRTQIRKLESYIAGLQEGLSVVPDTTDQPTVRSGSKLAQARDYLRSRGGPVHIKEIVIALGKEPTKANVDGLAGNLNSYVRRRLVFTRPGPAMFSLRDARPASTPNGVLT